MAGIVRPRSFPIRKITDTVQKVGRIFNSRRFPDHGGFTSAGKWGDNGEFKVEAPTNIKTAEESRGKSDD